MWTFPSTHSLSLFVSLSRSLSFNHNLALRKVRRTSAESSLMKAKTHRRPGATASFLPTCRSHNNSKQQGSRPQTGTHLTRELMGNVSLHFFTSVSFSRYTFTSSGWVSCHRFAPCQGSQLELSMEKCWRKEFNNTPSHDLSLSGLCLSNKLFPVFCDRLCLNVRFSWNGVWAVKLQLALKG